MVTTAPRAGSTVTPGWVGDVEAAHALVMRAAWLLAQEGQPPIDLTPAGEGLSRASGSLLDAFDRRAPRLDAVRRAALALGDAAHALDAAKDTPSVQGSLEAIGRARGHLERAEVDLVPRPEEAPPEPGELRVSGDAPRLHALERACLPPLLRFAEPVAPPEPEPPADASKPKTRAELRARIAELKARAQDRAKRPAAPERAEPAGAADPPALDERAFVHARTREMLEEVAMVGLQRAPLLGDPWRSALLLERRMLRAIDAVASMGETALAYVEKWAQDAPAKDPTRVFAATMVLGCFAGRDTLAAAERIFRDYELVDPDCRRPFVAALELVPHDCVPTALRTLLADADERHRAAAIEVLAYRGLATEAEIVSAAHDVPLVAAVALPHLAARRHASAQQAIDRALAASGAADQAELRSAAWLAMALCGHPATAATLTAALDGAEADEAALLLALSGDGRDALALVERLRGAPSAALATAVGWAGPVSAIGPLIDLLGQDDERLRETAAYALERITAAGLLEEAEIDAEEIDVTAPPDPDVGEPRAPRLSRLSSDPRDTPPEPSTETIERPSTDPERWRAWWQAHGADLPAGRRFRAGRPYSPLVSLWELDEARRTPAERRALGHELVLRTGASVHFDVHDFVVVQESSLQAWQPAARRASNVAGSW